MEGRKEEEWEEEDEGEGRRRVEEGSSRTMKEKARLFFEYENMLRIHIYIISYHGVLFTLIFTFFTREATFTVTLSFRPSDMLFNLLSDCRLFEHLFSIIVESFSSPTTAATKFYIILKISSENFFKL